MIDNKKVIAIMRQTRKMLLPHWGKVKIERQKTKSAADAVTKLDLKVEKFVSGALKKLYPEVDFAGEEFGGERSKKYWLMDPIDGTQHFVRGLPFCTSMLALVENDKPIMGFIYDFINDQMYSAVKGKGAFCNNKRIYVSNRPLNKAYLCWESRLKTKQNLKIHRELRKKSLLLKTITAGWEYAMIACGKLDGRVNFSPYGYDYDFVPGAFIVSEAGGVVTNLYSKDYKCSNTDLIAANKVVYKELTSGEKALFPVK